MRRMLAYYRVSSEGQEDNTSLDNQKQRVRAYCQAMEIELVDEYQDVETASGKATRDGFDAALAALESDESLSGLIVYDIDRYFRNCGEGLRTFEKHFKSNGHQLISIRQNFDTSTDEGWMALGMFLLFAEYELRKITRRTREGVDAARSAGWFAGGQVPYGYDPVFVEEANRYALKPNAKEQRWIKEMREQRAAGKGCRGIAQSLNEQRAPGKDGKKKTWEHKSVERILKYVPGKVVD